MTCENCIYYHSISTLCDKYIYPEERQNRVCSMFTYNDGTYYNKIWHCPKCGNPVEKWGLCDICKGK